MAISIGQTTREKIQKKASFPAWAIWLLILIVISGAIIYFLFVSKTPEAEISSGLNGEALTKEELDKFQGIIETVQGSPFKYLKQTVSESFLSSPPKSRIGTQSNPFE